MNITRRAAAAQAIVRAWHTGLDDTDSAADAALDLLMMIDDHDWPLHARQALEQLEATSAKTASEDPAAQRLAEQYVAEARDLVAAAMP